MADPGQFGPRSVLAVTHSGGTALMVLWTTTALNPPGLWQGSVLTLAQAPAALTPRPLLGLQLT